MSTSLVPAASTGGIVVGSFPATETDKKVLAVATVKATNTANTPDSIFAGLFGLAGAAVMAKYRELYPVIAFNNHGIPTGYFLSPTFNSARAQACKAQREGYTCAVVLEPLATGKYTYADLAAGNWSAYAVYIPVPKVNGRKIAKFTK